MSDRIEPLDLGKINISEYSLRAYGQGQIGPAEVGPVEVGPVEVRDPLARLPTPIPFRDPFWPSLEQPQRLVTVHDFDLPAL